MRPRHAIPAALALLFAASCGVPGEEPAGYESFAYTTICPKGATVEGVDVASCQTADWPTVKASGRVFAIVKATEGDGKTWFYVNPRFKGDWSGIKSAGMIRGAYHYFLPSKDGTDQANYFYQTVGGWAPDDIPPMLDWEDTRDNGDVNNPVIPTATIIQHAQQFLTRIQQLTGRKPLIYTYPDYFQNQIGGPAGFENYYFNIATYLPNKCPLVPPPFTHWDFWQWDSNQLVPGITVTQGTKGCPSTVDVDRYNGTLAELLQWLNPAPALAQVNGNDGISLVNWASDGHSEAFVVSPSGDLSHLYSNGNGDGWSQATKLSSGGGCGFAASYWTAPYDYAELFSPEGSATGHLWWANNMWNTLQDFGGMGLSHLSTIVGNDGLTTVFALGSDGAMWHNAFDETKKAWAGWQSLGGKFTTGASGMLWLDGHIDIYATDGAGAVWQDYYTAGTWKGWTMLPSGPPIASRPAIVRYADGHGELFARGTDGRLYHSEAPGVNKDFPAFSALPSTTRLLGEPSAIYNHGNGAVADGPEVFARDETGQVLHLWWDGKAYTDFAPLFGERSASDPFAWIRGDGAAEVFATGTDGMLSRAYRGVKQGQWSSWSEIASGVNPCAEPIPVVPDMTTQVGVDAGMNGMVMGGCSCAVGGRAEGSGWIGWAVMMGIVLVLRRRK